MLVVAAASGLMKKNFELYLMFNQVVIIPLFTYFCAYQVTKSPWAAFLIYLPVVSLYWLTNNETH